MGTYGCHLHRLLCDTPPLPWHHRHDPGLQSRDVDTCTTRGRLQLNRLGGQVVHSAPSEMEAKAAPLGFDMSDGPHPAYLDLCVAFS